MNHLCHLKLAQFDSRTRAILSKTGSLCPDFVCAYSFSFSRFSRIFAFWHFPQPHRRRCWCNWHPCWAPWSAWLPHSFWWPFAWWSLSNSGASGAAGGTVRARMPPPRRRTRAVRSRCLATWAATPASRTKIRTWCPRRPTARTSFTRRRRPSTDWIWNHSGFYTPRRRGLTPPLRRRPRCRPPLASRWLHKHFLWFLISHTFPTYWAHCEWFTNHQVKGKRWVLQTFWLSF